jgi:phosphoribosylformylglycinamidine (FGAM) synthase-like enzyme
VLLGETRDEFGGSTWAHVIHQHLGGHPPTVDLDAERRLADVVRVATQEGLLASAHDLSDGGLAIALAESCLRGGRGARVTLPGDPFTALFSESAARAIVSVQPGREREFEALCARNEIPATVLGDTGGGTLMVEGTFEVPLDELKQVWEATLPALFG